MMPPASPRKDRLIKNADHIIAGVCSRIAVFFKVNVMAIRLLFGILLMFFPWAILIYYVLTLFLPVTDPDGNTTRDSPVSRLVILFGVAISVAMILYIAKRFFPDMDMTLQMTLSFTVLCSGVSIFFDGIHFKGGIVDMISQKIILGIIMAGLSIMMILSAFNIGTLDTGMIFEAIKFEWPVLLCALILNLLIPRKRFSVILWMSILSLTTILALILPLA